MKNQDKTKENILKGVNKKLKIRETKMVIIVCVVCILIGIIAFLITFEKQIPIIADEYDNLQMKYEAGSGEILSSDLFKGISVSIGNTTINELDNRELPYNNLQIPIRGYLMFTLERNGHFYAENNDGGKATLYFYISETLIDKIMGDRTYNLNVLLYPELCHTDEFINEITKIYYLVYDYDNFNQQDFDKAKSQAVLLWEK